MRFRPAALTDWPVASPADCGVRQSVLDGALSQLLAKEKTRAAALVVGGRLVWERYWDGYGPCSLFDTYSVGKAFTAVAIGLLAKDGALSVDDPACRYIEPWSRDERAQITLRHLLTMTSGLHWDDPTFGKEPDPAEATLRKTLEYRPGTVWRYEQSTAHALAMVAQKASGQDLLAFLQSRVLGPLGIERMDWLRAPSGQCLGWRSILSNARDLCRFGEWMLRRGNWAGKQLLDESFFSQAVRVDALAKEAKVVWKPHDIRRQNYGWLLFVNENGLWPGIDPSCYALLGAWGNACLIDPVHQFVFVRLVTPEGRVEPSGEPRDELFGNNLDSADLGTAKMWRTVRLAFKAPVKAKIERRVQTAVLNWQGDMKAKAKRYQLALEQRFPGVMRGF